MNPEVMNHLVWQVAQVVAVRNHLLPERPIWLSELQRERVGGGEGREGEGEGEGEEI